MIRVAIRHVQTVLGLAAVSVLLVSCNKNEPPSAGETGKAEHVPVIYTTSYPMQYFTERISWGRAPVVCHVPGDQAAFLRTINAEVIQAYQNADLIVINGAGYERWIEMVSLPEARVVDTAKPFEKEFIKFEKAVTHSHGPAGLHEHKGIDGHTWVDPVNAKIQAGEIAEAMKKRFPEHAAAFEDGWGDLAKDLDGLHAELSRLAKEYTSQPILASHPAYNYIARRYRWNLTSLDLDPEEMPSDQTFAEIKALLRKAPAKHILWESYPTEEIAERFREELGIESVEFSPCELLGDEEIKAGLDYLKVMRANIENVRKVLVP